ncbi:XkdX family protein [Clostridium baratii]|uniref:XkdX family protein n=1 Tax=Clostridium baratii TaxID=1561 RepID=UPI000B338CEF|nr:XkdX family protein [Clostridium baratii]
MNDNFKFWKMAYSVGISIELLSQAVITEENPYGEITKEEFREISGEEFVN